MEPPPEPQTLASSHFSHVGVAAPGVAATPGVMWPGAHPHGMGGAYGTPPPDLAGAAPVEETPYDILSFPAGLIPTLVKNALRCCLMVDRANRVVETPPMF